MEGWVKINSDEVAKSKSNISGYGGLIRDHKERWLFGYARPLVQYSAFDAECSGIICGFQATWELGYRKIHLESDFNALLQCLSKLNHTGHHLICIIRELLQLKWEVTIMHFY